MKKGLAKFHSRFNLLGIDGRNYSSNFQQNNMKYKGSIIYLNVGFFIWPYLSFLNVLVLHV